MTGSSVQQKKEDATLRVIVPSSVVSDFAVIAALNALQAALGRFGLPVRPGIASSSNTVELTYKVRT